MRRTRKNPAQFITYTDGLILVGIGAIVGGLGYWLYSKSQANAADASGTAPGALSTGPDAAGNLTSATPPNASGIGVFTNTSPGSVPLGPVA